MYFYDIYLILNTQKWNKKCCFLKRKYSEITNYDINLLYRIFLSCNYIFSIFFHLLCINSSDSGTLNDFSKNTHSIVLHNDIVIQNIQNFKRVLYLHPQQNKIRIFHFLKMKYLLKNWATMNYVYLVCLLQIKIQTWNVSCPQTKLLRFRNSNKA